MNVLTIGTDFLHSKNTHHIQHARHSRHQHQRDEPHVAASHRGVQAVTGDAQAGWRSL